MTHGDIRGFFMAKPQAKAAATRSKDEGKSTEPAAQAHRPTRGLKATSSASSSSAAGAAPKRRAILIESDTDEDEDDDRGPSATGSRSTRPKPSVIDDDGDEYKDDDEPARKHKAFARTASDVHPKAPAPAAAREVAPTAFFAGSRVVQSDKVLVKAAPPSAAKGKHPPAPETKSKSSKATNNYKSKKGSIDDVHIDVVDEYENAIIAMDELEQITRSVSEIEARAASNPASQAPAKPPARSPAKSPAKKAPVTPTKPVTTPQRKRKTTRYDDDDDDDDDYAEEAVAAKHVRTPTSSSKSKASQPTTPKRPITAATTPTRSHVSSPAQKLAFLKFLNRQSSGSRAPGSKPIPVGAPDCLSGLSFVFTGDLSSITRDQAKDLVKRYGGRVVTAPSSKTSYVVIGEEPGPSKIEKVKQLDLKTLDEDGFFELISATAVHEQKQGPSFAAIKKEDVVPTRQTSAAPTVHVPSSVTPVPKKLKLEPSDQHQFHSHQQKQPAPAAPRIFDPSSQLWPDKYKPQCYEDMIGNQSNVTQLAKWLNEWTRDGRGGPSMRACLLSGPPGIGKTTAAHLVARTEGFEIIELNASDTRSKSALESIVKESTGTVSLMSMFDGTHGHHATSASPSKSKGKGKAKSVSASHESKGKVIIMDEVDGMSAGDRGGVAELIQIIKKTRVPIVCICNDRASPKIRSLANHCLDLRFRRPTAQMIEARMKQVCAKEGLELKPNSIVQLAESTCGDIRQILNILSSYRLTSDLLTYDDSKTVSRSILKNVTLSPFDIAGRLLGQQSFRDLSFNDKIDLYFHDYSIVPLMIQENYIMAQPALAREKGLSGRRNELECLRLLSEAADAISQGDLIETVQRRENNWGLMPVHAVMSTVRPCFFAHGGLRGRLNFAGWLGQNSKQTKTQRLLREIQIHMRLSASGDRSQIRQTYLPVLAQLLVQPLVDRGADGVPDVIRLMDAYYLSRDDYDALGDLGFGGLMERVATATKSAFTRMYNKVSHPVAILSVVPSKAAVKRAASGTGGGVPDLEEVLDEDGDGGSGGGGGDDDGDDGSADDDDDNLGADRYIKQKSSGGGASKSTKRGGGSSSGGRGRGGGSSSTGRGRGARGGRGRGRGRGRSNDD